MELDRLLPLLVIWIIWSIINRKGKKRTEKIVPLPVPVQEEMGELEPVAMTVPLSPESGVETTEQLMEKHPPKRTAAGPARCGVAFGYPGRNFLQQAVVWSEILAPPVSLRDDK